MADEDDLSEAEFWVQQSAMIEGQQAAAKDFADIRRGYYDVAFPAPEKVRLRIPLITRLRNELHVQRVLRAKNHIQALDMLHKTGTVDWPVIGDEHVDLYLQYQVSIKGGGRTELRDTARFTQPQVKKRGGMMGLLRP
jgi:hypothetical protein